MDVPEETSKALGSHPSLSLPFVMTIEICRPDLPSRVRGDTLAAKNAPLVSPSASESPLAVTPFPGDPLPETDQRARWDKGLAILAHSDNSNGPLLAAKTPWVGLSCPWTSLCPFLLPHLFHRCSSYRHSLINTLCAKFVSESTSWRTLPETLFYILKCA